MKNITIEDYESLKDELERVKNDLENANIMIGLITKDRDSYQRMYNIERDNLIDKMTSYREMQREVLNMRDQLASLLTR